MGIIMSKTDFHDPITLGEVARIKVTTTPRFGRSPIQRWRDRQQLEQRARAALKALKMLATTASEAAQAARSFSRAMAQVDQKPQQSNPAKNDKP